MCKKLARSRSVLARGLIVLVTSAICGCGVVDNTVGSRTVKFNDQAADSRAGTILLNIIRAAYGMPLQFTDIQTNSINASTKGTFGAQSGANIQVPLNHLANQMPRTAAVSPQISLGGEFGGQYTTQAATLNTQEFYKGIQTPFTKKQLHYYLTGNWPLEDWQLLTLFVSSITVKNGNETLTLKGKAQSSENYEAFARTIGNLVAYGLTIEKRSAEEDFVGPTLEVQEDTTKWLLAALVTASTQENPEKGLTLKCREKKEDKTKVPLGKCRLKKPGSITYEFCFAPEQYPRPNISLYTQTRTAVQPGSVIPLFETSRQGALEMYPLTKQHSCKKVVSEQKDAKQQDDPHKKKQHEPKKQQIDWEIRSLEGIFYFLGEMVRTELGHGDDGRPTELVLYEEEGSQPLHLFRVQARRPSKGEIGVKYKGQWFSVAVDPSGYDASSRVLQLLADLLALQAKAKDFPASNVVTIANP